MSQFAAAVREALDREVMSINDLATELDTAYEHARRLARGFGLLSSRLMLKEICKVLKLDEEKMRTLIVRDQLQNSTTAYPKN